AVAAANFDQNISAARDQDLLYNAGMSSVAPDPNAASSALLSFGVQVATDFPFSPAAKGATRLTLGRGEALAGEAARLGEHGVANAPAKPLIKPPVPQDVPRKPTSALEPDKLFAKPPVNNTDIDRAAQKRAAT